MTTGIPAQGASYTLPDFCFLGYFILALIWVAGRGEAQISVTLETKVQQDRHVNKHFKDRPSFTPPLLCPSLILASIFLSLPSSDFKYNLLYRFKSSLLEGFRRTLLLDYDFLHPTYLSPFASGGGGGSVDCLFHPIELQLPVYLLGAWK